MVIQTMQARDLSLLDWILVPKRIVTILDEESEFEVTFEDGSKAIYNKNEFITVGIKRIP